jgi:phosphoribosylformylglycinamidine (FGAM) synthase PurS component
MQAEWSWSITDPEAVALLQALADKGWFVRQVDVWKTHLAR